MKILFASMSRTSHQIFSIWWNCHAQDVSSVPNMSVLCSFPSTWYCVQFLAALDIPWWLLKKNKSETTIKKQLRCFWKTIRFNGFFSMEDLKHFKVYSHLMMEQSLAAEKMYLSLEVMTRQVIGSLWPLNSLISEASGGKSCREEINVYRKHFLQENWAFTKD